MRIITGETTTEDITGSFVVPISDITGNFGSPITRPLPYQRTISVIEQTLSSVINKPLESNTTGENKAKEIKESSPQTDSFSKTFKDSYFQTEFITPELRIGHNLLETSKELVKKSLESIQQRRRKESDEYIMQFKTHLPELFCCRNISESFGAIINSISTALSNLKGNPLSEKQLIALNDILTGLLREPAMPFEKAVTYVSEFENADFEVESESLSDLLRLVEMFDKGEIEI